MVRHDYSTSRLSRHPALDCYYLLNQFLHIGTGSCVYNSCDTYQLLNIDVVAEWSKALDLGSNLRWRGFKSHRHHNFDKFIQICSWYSMVSHPFDERESYLFPRHVQECNKDLSSSSHFIPILLALVPMSFIHIYLN